MSVLPTILLILGAVLLSPEPRVGAAGQWKPFTSKTLHFSVLYPASWNRLLALDDLPDPDRLDIINFPNRDRAEGVVIKRGGASISVVGVPPDSPPFYWHSVDDWIGFSLPHRILIDQSEIPIAAPPSGGCSKLKRVVTQFETSPGAYQVYTNYYCEIGGRLYGTFLANWKGDPHQSDLQEIALKIALSLRSR